MRVQGNAVSVLVGDVWRDDLGVGAQARAEDRVVAKHVQRVFPDPEPALEGVVGIARVELVGHAPCDPRHLGDHDPGRHRSAEEEELDAAPDDGDDRDQREDRERQQAGTRKGQHHRRQQEQQRDERRSPVHARIGVHGEARGDRHRRFEKERDRVGARVQRLGGVREHDRLPLRERDRPCAEVEDREQRRAGDKRARDDAHVPRGVEHVEPDIEKDHRLEEVRAQEAQRPDVVARDENADDRGEQQQRRGDLERRAAQPPRAGLHERGDIQRGGEEDQSLEQGRRNRTDPVADHVQR